MQRIQSLYVAETENKGKGVFTADDINKGDLIEICPIIFIPEEELKLIDKTVFYNYYILWPEPEGSACIALGFGSIYNHSNTPNAEITLDIDHQTVDFLAKKDIDKGEEICIDYTGGKKDAPGLWFEPL